MFPSGAGQTMHFDPQHVPVDPSRTNGSALRDYYDFFTYNQSTQGHHQFGWALLRPAKLSFAELILAGRFRYARAASQPAVGATPIDAQAEERAGHPHVVAEPAP
jgi:hypothetical protein